MKVPLAPQRQLQQHNPVQEQVEVLAELKKSLFELTVDLGAPKTPSAGGGGGGGVGGGGGGGRFGAAAAAASAAAAGPPAREPSGATAQAELPELQRQLDALRQADPQVRQSAYQLT